MTDEQSNTGGNDARAETARAMGNRIGQARREAGYRTAQDFADALDVSVWTVRSWESGKSQPRYDMLGTISKLTSRPQAWFLGEGVAYDRLDRAIGELLARCQAREGAAETMAEVAGVFGVAPADSTAAEELQALTAAAREWNVLIKVMSPSAPASADEIAAMHLALANLMAADAPAGGEAVENEPY